MEQNSSSPPHSRDQFVNHTPPMFEFKSKKWEISPAFPRSHKNHDDKSYSYLHNNDHLWSTALRWNFELGKSEGYLLVIKSLPSTSFDLLGRNLPPRPLWWCLLSIRAQLILDLRSPLAHAAEAPPSYSHFQSNESSINLHYWIHYNAVVSISNPKPLFCSPLAATGAPLLLP